VIVGQKKALFLAVRDWRRAPRHTALGGLLAGTLGSGWGRRTVEADETTSDIDSVLWEGSPEGMP
jgi:hypothetical protein